MNWSQLQWTCGALVLCAGACAPVITTDDVRRAQQEELSQSAALVQTVRPLEYSEQNNDAPALLAGGDNGLVTGGAGAAGVDASQAMGGSAVTTVGAPVRPGGEGLLGNEVAPVVYDATEPFTAQVSVSALRVAGSASCQLMAPFQSVGCKLSGLSLASSQLSGGKLQMVVNGADGRTEVGLSNSLEVKKYVVRQLADARGDAALDDITGAVTEVADELYFVAARPDGFLKLMRLNPATSQLRQISNLQPGSHDDVEIMSAANGRLYFSGSEAGGRRKLFAYDPVGDNVSVVSDLSSAASDDPGVYATLATSGGFYFDALVSGVRRLVRLENDGSTLTVPLRSNANPLHVDDPRELTAVGANIYLVANIGEVAGEGVAKLLRYTPGTGELRRLSDTAGGDSFDDDPRDLHVDGNALYFSAQRAPGVRKLFAYSLNTGELRQISNTIGTRLRSDEPGAVVTYHGRVFFAALNASQVSKLFRYDPTTGNTTQISNTRNDNTLADLPDYLTEYQGKLFFSSLSRLGTQKLYSYDDNTGVLNLAVDSRQNLKASSVISAVAVYGNRLYMASGAKDTCADAIYGSCPTVTKLFAYDDRSHALVQVTNTRANTVSSDSPAELSVVGNRLLFTSRNADRGRKLFSLCDLSTGCVP